MLQYTGILKVKKDAKQVSEKFKLREFVLTDNATSYPQVIPFQLTQDRCSFLDNIKVGDEVTVDFQLKGREWKNPQGEIKYFSSLDVFKIKKEKASQYSTEEATATSATLNPVPDDDLPF